MPFYEYKGKRPKIAADAWIAPTAVLIGDVTVKSGASVWWGTVLRGDMDAIVIGERSNVQDNTTIHTDPGAPTIIAPDVTIGHMALVHSSVVESNVLIGQASVLVGHNIVRSGTIIGAGAVLSVGYEAPANSLVVGIPGRVVREAKPEDARWTVTATEHYVELSTHYRAHILNEVEPERF